MAEINRTCPHKIVERRVAPHEKGEWRCAWCYQEFTPVPDPKFEFPAADYFALSRACDFETVVSIEQDELP